MCYIVMSIDYLFFHLMVSIDKLSCAGLHHCMMERFTSKQTKNIIINNKTTYFLYKIFIKKSINAWVFR